MDRLLKVAMPLDALTGVVPDRVPPPGFVPMAIAIEADDEVTTLPPRSLTCTVTAGVMVAPPVVLVGCWPNTTCVAAPGVMLKAFDVTVLLPGRTGVVAVRV